MSEIRFCEHKRSEEITSTWEESYSHSEREAFVVLVRHMRCRDCNSSFGREVANSKRPKREIANA